MDGTLLMVLHSFLGYDVDILRRSSFAPFFWREERKGGREEGVGTILLFLAVGDLRFPQSAIHFGGENLLCP